MLLLQTSSLSFLKCCSWGSEDLQEQHWLIHGSLQWETAKKKLKNHTPSFSDTVPFELDTTLCFHSKQCPIITKRLMRKWKLPYTDRVWVIMSQLQPDHTDRELQNLANTMHQSKGSVCQVPKSGPGFKIGLIIVCHRSGSAVARSNYRGLTEV